MTTCGMLFPVVVALLVLPNVGSILLELDVVICSDDEGPVAGDEEVLGDHLAVIIIIGAVLHEHGDIDVSLTQDLAKVPGRDAYVADAGVAFHSHPGFSGR
uniref:Secreted protein n=1 Tax=Anguilla anguilla TaxID=7936 RepID=A0A0E9QQ36_ANGAN